ncbi:MAG TPA: hypothetical protein VF384_09045 [Planctomycetota bacterium]
MRVVLVSSPGASSELHWSHGAAAELARLLLLGGANVLWLPATYAGQSLPSIPPGIHVRPAQLERPAPLWRVNKCRTDAALEVLLTRSLRERPAHAVVHLGVGARGSPNVLWLADCLGSAPIAVVRAAEVVCQRGDLVHASGVACTQFDDPDRCQRCCRASVWSQPHRVELLNRADLLAAGLLAAEAVFVASPAEAEVLVKSGVPQRVITVDGSPQAAAARVLSAGVEAI